MELGNPPLYVDVRRSVRMVDRSNLQTLGPLAKAQNELMMEADSFKEHGDKQAIGQQFKGQVHNMAGVFLLFKSIQVEQGMLVDWNRTLPGQEVNLSQVLTCNQLFAKTIELAFKHINLPLKPVLLVISCQNY